MYKVMVVDDEQWGRKSIRKLIDELSTIVEVVAEAKHGEEALQLIQISKPDIVVTDMNMPVMDGKVFLEKLYAMHKEIKVIVISGYSEFEYLKAALTYEVCDYVLKPVSITDLNNAITKAIGAVEKDGDLRQQKRHASTSLKLKQEVFLQHVSHGRIVNHTDMANQATEFKIAQAFNQYRLAIVSFRQFKEVAETKYHGNADLFMFSLENVLTEIIEKEAFIVYTADDRMKLCIIMPVADDFNNINRILNEFQQAVYRMLKVDVVVGISRIYEKIDTLPLAFEQALKYLWLNKFHGTGLSISMADTDATAPYAETLTSFDLKAMKQAIVNKNEKETKGIVEQFVNRTIRNKELLIQDVHYGYMKLTETIAGALQEVSVLNQTIFDYHALYYMMERDSFTHYIDKINAMISEAFIHFAGQDSSFPVQEITDYLQKHYFEEISLVDVSTRFHIEPSYFSKLFKAVTNENFIEYLTRLRMEKACELLSSTEQKINEIAELTGYENQRYFSQVFKKFTGLTPSEYREAQEGNKSITKK
ncbi:response regulator [Paenibacillus psychroresistens]|uniref:Response regulator n=1 Tax=Paenibacillus psychroresistens TaxID=1778678 RepID=A0A6B8RW31_9BACL|nr:helix-turn-helix domain-containing protein [Paenibacillus psychroresistens]QGQ99865.1 response regulator [Paenibacillus psychroresistens]